MTPRATVIWLVCVFALGIWFGWSFGYVDAVNGVAEAWGGIPGAPRTVMILVMGRNVMLRGDARSIADIAAAVELQRTVRHQGAL